MYETEEEVVAAFNQMIEENGMDMGNGDHASSIHSAIALDEVAVSEYFNNWTDMLRDDGMITTEMYNEVTHPLLP
jgi:hypothetical protein